MDSKNFIKMLEELWGVDTWKGLDRIHIIPPDNTVVISILCEIPVTISLTLDELKITDRKKIRDILYEHITNSIYSKSENVLDKGAK